MAERSAGESVIHCQVEPEDAIDSRALPGAPSFTDGADDTEARGNVFPRTSDREHE